MEILRETISNNGIVKEIKGLSQNHRLFLVGGAIRDILLGIKPKDYDFAVSDSGIAFARKVARAIKGSFVLLSKKDDEARVVKDEIIYDFIGFKDDIRDDLKRRDFTINAMAVDLETFEFLDPFNGLKDLQHKIIRLTSEGSLIEDSLRVLRGFRFALELNFKIDKRFYDAVKGVSLKRVAGERIGYELLRIMSASDSYWAIEKMNELGLFPQIFPEARKIIEDAFLWGHSLNTYYALERLMKEGFFTTLEPEFSQYFSVPRRKPLLKLAGLFHDVAKPDTFLMKEGDVHFYGHDTMGARIIEVLGYRRLKLSRNDVSILKKLVKEHMRPHLLATNDELTDRAIRRFFRDLGEDYFGSMMLAWADGYATAGKTRHLEEKFLRMIALKRADESKPKVERLVNGYDLIALGLKPGPIFKIILQELLDMQLEGKIKTKEEGLKLVPEICQRYKE
uniref:CCA tRNA nucleotidyltransferase n=1 Tax=candidate division WOR-3 bacterium TaxID=2052148 RepID=A0A7C4TFS0_UNCW3